MGCLGAIAAAELYEQAYQALLAERPHSIKALRYLNPVHELVVAVRADPPVLPAVDRALAELAAR